VISVQGKGDEMGRGQPWCREAAGLSVILLSAIFAAGCTALAGPAKIENYSAPTKAHAFSGLLPSPGAPGDVQRYIFQIHGMQTTNDDWMNQLFAGIRSYGYRQISGAAKDALLTEPMIVRGRGLKDCGPRPGECRYTRFGTYQKDVFVNDTTHDRVTVFTYRWRDDMWKINRQYLQADIDANSFHWWLPNTRKSEINAGLKGSLLDNGISDAAGYASDLHIVAREGLESALCAMYADAIGTPAAADVAPGKGCLERLAPLGLGLASKKVEFNFLSHSLGSRMLYDVLSSQEPSRAEVPSSRAMIANRTRTFFMAANQMPLLATAALTVSPERAGPHEGLPTSFFELRQRADGSSKALLLGRSVDDSPLTIVAFQDPDDLLGFKASDGVIADPPSNVRFVDVVHRNTPQLLFLLAWPYGAHDAELQERRSLKMILCGATAYPNGQLSPDDCRTD
jgi:hypothetical protein